jgi:hypothetical protein
MSLIKYNPGATGLGPSATTENNVLRKGNMFIDPIGPAKDSLYYNAVPATGGSGTYVVYQGVRTGLSIDRADSDAALISLANRASGLSFPNSGTALAWFATQNDRLVVNREYQSIVMDGLVMNLESSYVPSYPTTGATWYDTSSSVNNGAISGGPGWTASGWFLFDGSDDQVTIPNTSSLQVTGDQTLEFVVRPDARVSRRNWYEKSYGGEGTITYETGGSLTYYWGTAGSDNQPYQGVSTLGTPLAVTGTWYHVALVRELSTATKTVKWYINGALEHTVTASYTAAVASTKPVLLGNGYAGRFVGGMAYARQYNIALSAAQISQNYYGGAIVTSGLVMALDAANLVSYPRSGTVWYGLTGGVTGALQSGPTFSNDCGGTIVLDGTNDYVSTNYGKDINPFNNPLTVSIFIKPNLVNTNQVYISTGQSRGNGDSNQRMYIAIYNGNWDWGIRSSSWGSGNVAASLAWSNIAVVIDSTNARFYLNGEQIYTKSVNNTFVLNDNFWFGAHDSNYYFNGSIGLAKIYNRALSANEIKQNYNATKWRFGLD